MDDTDAARSTEAFAQGIRADLDWLGMTPDDEVKQSDRFARYEEMFGRLVASGRIYPCYESAQELELKRKVLLSRWLQPVYDRAGMKLNAEHRARWEAEGRRQTGRAARRVRACQYVDISAVAGAIKKK